jgi:pyruvate kinase
MRHHGETVRKTKIVATLGPATDRDGVLPALIDAGVDVARLNFSHGQQEDHRRRCAEVRRLAGEAGRSVAVLADLQGPKVRVGRVSPGGVELVAGRTVTVTTRDVVGNGRIVPCDWPGLPGAVRPGERIFLDDGRIELEVVRAHGDEVEARVIEGGRLSDRKSINLPGVALDLPSLTDKDLADLRFAVEELDVDFVALSFVRSGADVRSLKARLAELPSRPAVVAKIEKPEAVGRIDEVFAALDLGDGIMVARGDLGVEAGAKNVPALQKRLLRRADELGIVCITATQMLESMVASPTPTRAEASDVFNAILDGTDAAMLSGETAVGGDPVAVVRTMAEIILEAEAWVAEMPPQRLRADFHDDTFELPICRAAAQAAREADARAVIALTRSGRTAVLLSKVDVPAPTPVLALTADPRTFRRMALYHGVRPLLLDRADGSGADLWDRVDRALVASGALHRGDVVVIASGLQHTKGATNVCKIVRLGERDLY